MSSKCNLILLAFASKAGVIKYTYLKSTQYRAGFDRYLIIRNSEKNTLGIYGLLSFRKNKTAVPLKNNSKKDAY